MFGPAQIGFILLQTNYAFFMNVQSKMHNAGPIRTGTVYFLHHFETV